jgi:hypothetical protein
MTWSRFWNKIMVLWDWFVLNSRCYLLLHMPHCLLIFTIYERVHFIYAMPNQGAGASQGTAQPASQGCPAGGGRQAASHGSCPASQPARWQKHKRVKREEKYMYLDEKRVLIHQMSLKTRCKHFGCRFSDVNVRNPILAKPHVWVS